TDPAAVRGAMAAIETAWGPVMAIVHGAGGNDLVPLAELDADTVDRAFAAKVGGLEHVLQCVRPDAMRLLVAFGSITARTGMRADAHYALANAWLARRTSEFGEQSPSCRCLAIEWTVW